MRWSKLMLGSDGGDDNGDGLVVRVLSFHCRFVSMAMNEQLERLGDRVSFPLLRTALESTMRDGWALSWCQTILPDIFEILTQCMKYFRHFPDTFLTTV